MDVLNRLSTITLSIEKSRKMSSSRLWQQAFGLTLIVLLLAGCGGASAIPTATPTSTPSPIPGIDTTLMISGVEFRLNSVYYPEDLVPQENSDVDVVLNVMLEILSRSPNEENPSEWDVSVVDEHGRISTPDVVKNGLIHGVEGAEWCFVVTKASRFFILHLPDDQTVNLDSLLEK